MGLWVTFLFEKKFTFDYRDRAGFTWSVVDLQGLQD